MDVTFEQAKQIASQRFTGLIPKRAKENDQNWYFILNYPDGEPQMIFDVPMYCVPKNGDAPYLVEVGSDEFVDYIKKDKPVPLDD
ncbi:hypothetical protein D2E26_0467 [Bifidobacterium dolichotidis]|uniref:Uncharacterized protein n=1 Tax=Bifidobacterium dolichotidis TaxID=2306976 RepID=A0A430FSN6_9BIFI|nr:hypothetical protein [Bifidobacterium dolichotidis]RSX55904.1 hypothetical protein D2E26_0467 [Bifidobacterium dolichotidis]